MVMALALVGGWIRSYVIWDLVSVGDQMLGSTGGCLIWCKAPYENSDSFLWWHHQEAWAVPEKWYFTPNCWKFPYWSLTISLTLLSAGLILGKPRKRATTNA